MPEERYQSGDLLNSIDFSPNSEGVEIFATSGHAGYQKEYGTSKMGARPNLHMAIDESDPFIKQILEEVIGKALGGS